MSLTAIQSESENRSVETSIETPRNLGGQSKQAVERRAIWGAVSKQIKPGNHSAKEILAQAGMDWTVSARSIRADGKKGTFGKVIPGYKAIIRDDNGDCLSVMSDGYKIMQYSEALSFADEVFGGGGEQGYYESAGTLKKGAKGFINCLLPTTMFVNGDTMDKIERRVLIASSHDGSVPIVLKLVSLRVVCQNTFNAALRENSAEIRIKHTQKLEFKVQEAQKTLGLISAYFDNLQAVIDQLATTKMTQDNMQVFARDLLGVSRDAKLADIPTRTENNLDKLTWLFANGTGNSGQTRWDALNAATEYVDHERTGKGQDDTTRAENRAEAVLFGPGVKFKERALELLLN